MKIIKITALTMVGLIIGAFLFVILMLSTDKVTYEFDKADLSTYTLVNKGSSWTTQEFEKYVNNGEKVLVYVNSSPLYRGNDYIVITKVTTGYFFGTVTKKRACHKLKYFSLNDERKAYINEKLTIDYYFNTH